MKRQLVFVIACSIVAASALPVMAAAPHNDLVRNATGISSLPFSVEQDATESHTDGPRGCGNRGSVFYKFRPANDMRLQADTLGSGYDTVLTVLRGPLRISGWWRVTMTVCSWTRRSDSPRGRGSATSS